MNNLRSIDAVNITREACSSTVKSRLDTTLLGTAELNKLAEDYPAGKSVVHIFTPSRPSTVHYRNYCTSVLELRSQKTTYYQN